MTPKELARKHWEERRGDVDVFIKSCDTIILNNYHCVCILDYEKNISCEKCPFSTGNRYGMKAHGQLYDQCWDYTTYSRNKKWFDEYITELKRLKENNMFKLGDKVEVSDSGEAWYTATYLCDRSGYGYMGACKYVVVGNEGAVSSWEQVRKPNTKRQELQEKLKQAEQTVKEVREELERENEK